MPRPRVLHQPAFYDSSVMQTIDKPAASVKSAARALEVIDLFAQLRRGATLTEIAQRLDYPQSSASMLLRSLIASGHMRYDGHTREYLPAPRLALNWIPEPSFRYGAMARMIDDLCEATGATVILAVRTGLHAHYVHVAQAGESRFHVPVGTRRHLVWSSPGFCILRDEPEARIRALVHRTNAESRDGRTPLAAGEILRRIETVRREGYIYSEGLVTPGTGMIAMPIARPGDRPAYPLALCVADFAERIRRGHPSIVRALRSALDRHVRPQADDARSPADIGAGRF